MAVEVEVRVLRVVRSREPLRDAIVTHFVFSSVLAYGGVIVETFIPVGNNHQQ